MLGSRRTKYEDHPDVSFFVYALITISISVAAEKSRVASKQSSVHGEA